MTDATRLEPILQAGETCWRTAHADRFGVIVDAAQYFAAVRDAMLEAEETILLIGWDFDLRIKLLPGERPDDGPNELGAFLKHLVRRKPSLRILILKVGHGGPVHRQPAPAHIRAGAPGRRAGAAQVRQQASLDAAHHQKIVVIDDAVAFCGGIDMTVDRWDTREHAPVDVRRRRPDGSLAGPWHDATAVVDGAAARALGEVARARWLNATGRRLPAPRRAKRVWPSGVLPQFRDVEVGVARTMPKYEGRPEIREIDFSGRPIPSLRHLSSGECGG